ncbi:MAG: hypothetical protein MZV70_39965 [Desulfobacterales bacterium]|nr:hypothetical protein [Desulfobacterales bacterium]
MDIAGTIELGAHAPAWPEADCRRRRDRHAGQIHAIAFPGCLQRLPKGQLELIDLAGLPLDNLLERVSRLPASTAILYLGLQRDGAGRIFSSSATLKRVSQVANAPLFNFIDTALGYGSVGGRMTQIGAMARKTAEIALRVLSGESTAAIAPVVDRRQPGHVRLARAEALGHRGKRSSAGEHRALQGNVALGRVPLVDRRDLRLRVLPDAAHLHAGEQPGAAQARGARSRADAPGTWCTWRACRPWGSSGRPSPTRSTSRWRRCG